MLSPKSRPVRQITQDELLIWHGCRNQIRQLNLMKERIERSIEERLQEGAASEPGAHSAEIRRTGRRCKLVIY